MEHRRPVYWAGMKKGYDAHGTLPGSLEAAGGHPCRIRLIQYHQELVREQEVATVDELAGLQREELVTWIDLAGTPDQECLEALGRQFNLHPLALEDVVNPGQHSKIENYGKYLFIVLYLLDPLKAIRPVQVNIFLGADFVISICEEGEQAFHLLRKRIKEGQGLIRQQGSDFLAYCVCDAVVDHYFPILEQLGDQLTFLEKRTFAGASQEIVEEIHSLKMDLLVIGRLTMEAQEVLSEMMQGENSSLFGSSVAYYLRDVLDHTHQLSRSVDSYRQISDSTLNSHLSLKNHQMNEVIKVLTIITSIFIPLTFIVGVYGMNFQPEAGPLNMPEITWQYGYPFVWGVMLLVVFVMLIIFRRKGWL
ncbi:MAG TPA: magnesium/cobalt transporter CorA [Syntrophomonadaceae bacterium]|nr:magnesium/cobalt transporter CorA [Syntrophomonadaceae bacterium]